MMLRNLVEGVDQEMRNAFSAHEKVWLPSQPEDIKEGWRFHNLPLFGEHQAQPRPHFTAEPGKVLGAGREGKALDIFARFGVGEDKLTIPGGQWDQPGSNDGEGGGWPAGRLAG